MKATDKQPKNDDNDKDKSSKVKSFLERISFEERLEAWLESHDGVIERPEE